MPKRRLTIKEKLSDVIERDLGHLVEPRDIKRNFDTSSTCGGPRFFITLESGESLVCWSGTMAECVKRGVEETDDGFEPK